MRKRKRKKKTAELEHGKTCQIEVPLAELSELTTPDLAPGRVRIQVQLTEVGRRKGLAGFNIKLGIRLNPQVHQGDVTKMYLKFAKLLGR